MTLDTNIVIAYLVGDDEVVGTVKTWRREGRTLFLPTIVETEVLSFSGWTPREYREAVLFLEENFTSVSFDRSVARIAAEIRSHVRIKFPDAGIAATALSMHTPLWTRNVRDFQNVPGLTIFTL